MAHTSRSAGAQLSFLRSYKHVAALRPEPQIQQHTITLLRDFGVRRLGGAFAAR